MEAEHGAQAFSRADLDESERYAALATGMILVNRRGSVRTFFIQEFPRMRGRSCQAAWRRSE